MKMLFLVLVLFVSSVQASEISIPHQEKEVGAGLWMKRLVKYQLPSGPVPARGWPVVILYQGTMAPVQFDRKSDAHFGLIHEAELIERLLDNGFAVLAPNAIFKVGWVTNVARVGYEFTSDYVFISNILKEIETGGFGPLDSKTLFAAGISSGGYNTSRMAVSFAGRFKALAIHSGSYATCLGASCVVPVAMPADHPPTLFLYGAHDDLVPRWTVDEYYNALRTSGVRTELYINETAGHEYFPESPEKIVEWFKSCLTN